MRIASARSPTIRTSKTGINDLPQATNFFIRLFADDTFLCAQNNDILKLETEVNFELEKVYNWLASNKLTLNVSKSKFMMLTKKRNSNISVKINNEVLEECDTYKYLGVYRDKNLSWKPHINYICKKIAKACGALAKVRHYVGIQTLSNVYYALVNSYVRYGLTSWGNASAESLKPLETLVNRAVRIMSFAPLGRLNAKPVYKHLKILNSKKLLLLNQQNLFLKSKMICYP